MIVVDLIMDSIKYYLKGLSKSEKIDAPDYKPLKISEKDKAYMDAVDGLKADILKLDWDAWMNKMGGTK